MRIAAVLFWALTPALLWAAPAAPDKDDKAVNPVEKIRKDLDRPISLKIDKQPLSAAIAALRDTCKINIVLDSITIQQQLGFAPDQPPVPVAVDLKDVKAKTALRAILAPYGLGYVVLGDTVVVTTEDMAMLRQMRQRISVDLNKMELGAALKQISRETAANLILDSRVDKEAQVAVSLQIEDVPLETAVRLLSEMAGLKPVRVGNTLFVTKKEIANEMRSDPDFAQQNQPVAATNYINTFTPAQFINGLAPNPPPAVGPGSVTPVVPIAPFQDTRRETTNVGPGSVTPVVPIAPAPPATGTGAAPPPEVKKSIEDDKAPPASDAAPVKKEESK